MGGLTGHYALGRAWSGVLLATQVALGLELVRTPWRSWFALRTPGSWAMRVWAAASVLVLASGVWFRAGNVLRALPPSPRLSTVAKALHVVRPGPDLTWIRQQASVGDIVLADRTRFRRALPGYGPRAVVPAGRDPLLSDVDTRKADAARMLDTATPAPLRTQLLDRYRVRWLLVTRTDAVPTGSWSLQLAMTGPAGERLYAVE